MPQLKKLYMMAGVDGLIALVVGRIGVAGDVGRQRQLAGLLQNIQHIGVVQKAQQEQRLLAFNHLGLPAASSSRREPGLGDLLARTCASTRFDDCKTRCAPEAPGTEVRDRICTALCAALPRSQAASGFGRARQVAVDSGQ